MNHRQIWMAYSFSALCLMSAAEPARAGFFVPLGLPVVGENNTPSSFATDVSADGRVVVGNISVVIGTCCGITQAIRWTSEGDIAGFGLPPGDFAFRYATGVSADGSVVVGGGYSPSGRAAALRWTSENGIVQLGTLLPGDSYSLASGVSANGSVVVGSSSAESMSEAFRWTSADGMIGLGDLPGGDVGSQANGVSADGSVVVGWSHSGSDEAFRWTSADGMVGLGDLPGGDVGSSAAAASSDGSVIVGWGRSHPEAPEAFRWTNADGMVGLGYLAGGESWSIANDVSDDGAVIVGSSSSAIGQEAFLWDATNGMRSLSAVLADLGVDLTGWTLTTAAAISADATTIVGSGINPSGQQEAWVANIGVVPEPATVSVPFAGVMTIVACCRGTFSRRQR